MESRSNPVSGIPFILLSFYSITIFTFQQIQGTSLTFSTYILLFHLFWGLSFNLLGGLTSVQGWLIGFWGLQHVLISQLSKVFFWQAADTGLVEPLLTAEVYLSGSLSVMVGCLVFRATSTKKQSLVKKHLPQSYEKISIVLFYITLVQVVLNSFSSILAGFPRPVANLISSLPPIAFLALTYSMYSSFYDSAGHKLFNTRAVVLFLLLFSLGLLGASKEALFQPILGIFLVFVFVGRYFTLRNLIISFVVVVLIHEVLTPLSNNGRVIYRKETKIATVPALLDYLENHFSSWQRFQNYKQNNDLEAAKFRPLETTYYGRNTPLLDRFSLIHDADVLISAYKHRAGEGLGFFIQTAHLLPRSLTGDYIDLDYKGDYLAKVSGLINEDDDTTGVAFGFCAESFAIGKWWWTYIAPGLLVYVLFFVLHLLDVNGGDRIWSIFLIILTHHGFCEAGVMGLANSVLRLFPILFVIKKGVEALENSIRVSREKRAANAG